MDNDRSKSNGDMKRSISDASGSTSTNGAGADLKQTKFVRTVHWGTRR